MKLTILISFLFAMQLSASITMHGQVSLHMQNESLRDVFKEIEKQSPYRFFYNESFADLNKRIDISIENIDINATMNELLSMSDISYQVLNNKLVVIGPKKELQQQEVTVSGTVEDGTGNPIPGATITIKGTTRGTTSDLDGLYSLKNVSPESVLVFSFIGYETQEIIVGDRKEINIVLLETRIGLDEVVVIGYGSMSRAMLTTSISTVDNKALENVPYANPMAALQGTVAGVRVQNLSGQPGATPRIIVRGGTSIANPNAATPLYIIDGVIRDDMRDINSEDIESIQVLKDAAATAIYGARGSNGVVLITTKSGKLGELQVSYNYHLTTSEVAQTYNMAHARDYIYWARVGLVERDAFRRPQNLADLYNDMEAYGTGNDLTNNTIYTTQYLSPENEHKLNEGWESMPDPIHPDRTIIFKHTDWQDKIFRTSISHNHVVNVSGGVDKASFNSSINYMTTNGQVIETGYSRLAFTLNGELEVRDNLRFFANSKYTNSDMNQVFSEQNIFHRYASLAPTVKLRFEDGTLCPGVRRNTGNPLYFLPLDTDENSRETITLSLSGRWDILPGLSFEPSISRYKIAADNYTFLPSYIDRGVLVATRTATSSYSKTIQDQADALLNYINTFGASHNLHAMAGASYFGSEYLSLSARGQEAASDLIPTLNAANVMHSMNGSVSERYLLGYFGRVTYDFDRRYLLSMNLRYDGASQLGTEHKWGLFPGISIGWNLHNEDFWSAVIPQNLLRLKLRTSYGVNGNIGGLGDYTWQGAYSVGYQHAGSSAILNTSMPNPDLKWEQSKTLNFGADMGLFSDRVEIITDVYRRVTDDLITSLPLPFSTGFSSIQTNLGSLENRGFEIETSARVMPVTSDLQWNVSFNAAYTQHKIIQLPDNGIENNRIGGVYVWDPDIEDYAWKGGLQEGGRIGDMYSYVDLWVYSTDEEAALAPVNNVIADANKTMRGGDIHWWDMDGNGIIDGRDRAYLGNEFPVWTGGISSTASYRNFELFLRMDYMTGHTIYNRTRQFVDYKWALNMGITQHMIDNMWKEQGDQATMPAYSPGGNINGMDTNWGYAHYYEKGDFLCLREVTLSYNVPSEISRRLNISRMRFNITGTNLHYFTEHTGFNPEDGGRDLGRFPMPRNITFGSVVSF